ncbi:MAG: choice-of-anchor W domain-containing protein [Candidatus Campbellbacteria bacterium]|nr:choice-of-anchor W domain-containing protein [Candidatus Campbellbacteria bacterium]
MKRIILSIAVIAIAGVATFAGTQAFFSDTETSQGNAFVAGAVDIEIAGISDDYLDDDTVNDGPKPQFTPSDDGFSFELADLKPLDHGEVSYELTNDTNDAHVCAMVENTGNAENGRIDPEREAGDTTGSLNNTDSGLGELQNFMSFGGNSGISYGEWFEVGDLSSGGSETFGINYCFGQYDGSDNCVPNTSGDVNVAQTDSVEVDVSFYAEQTRNNPDFSCEDLNEGEQDVAVTQEDDWSTVDLSGGSDWFAKARNNNQNFELAVGTDDSSVSGQDTAEANWDAETEYDFTLTYDESENEATWEVDGETTQFTVGPDTFSNLGINAKAPNGVTTEISNLALSIYSGLSPDNFTANGNVSSLSVMGLNLNQDWTLTGTFEFSAVGSGFSQENPAVHISVN